jgi:hypothetical protein
MDPRKIKDQFHLCFQSFQIALVASRLGQFRETLKPLLKIILNFTRPHAITYTNYIIKRQQHTEAVVDDSTTNEKVKKYAVCIIYVSFPEPLLS